MSARDVAVGMTTQRMLLRAVIEVALDLDSPYVGAYTYESHQRHHRHDLPALEVVSRGFKGGFEEAADRAGMLLPGDRGSKRMLLRRARAELVLFHYRRGSLWKASQRIRHPLRRARRAEPDGAAMIGYRFWGQRATGELCGAHEDATWTPGLNEARCHRRRCRSVPGAGCGCGFHAYRSLAELGPIEGAWIYGAVSLSGDIVASQGELRAECAQVIGFLLPEQIDAAILLRHWSLAELYSVPLFSDPDELIDYARRNEIAVSGRRTSSRWSPPASGIGR